MGNLVCLRKFGRGSADKAVVLRLNRVDVGSACSRLSGFVRFSASLLGKKRTSPADRDESRIYRE